MHADFGDWWQGAAADLASAETLREGRHFNNAVFLARQAVEKSLNAFYLVVKQIEPPMDHGLRTMARELFDDVPREVWRNLASLDGDYTTTRYPSAMYARPEEAYTQADADLAIDGAREVITWLSKSLPDES